MAKYPKKHQEIPKVQVTVLAMDTIDSLPVTSREHLWALTAICMNRSYVFTIPI